MTNDNEKIQACSNCEGILEYTGDRIGKVQTYKPTQSIREPDSAYWRCKKCGQIEIREV